MNKTYCVHEFDHGTVRHWEQSGLVVDGQTLKAAGSYQSPSRPWVGNRGWNLLKAHNAGDEACHVAWTA